MFNIGDLSNKIGNKLATELNFDKDKKDVVTYGIFALLQIVTSILLTAVVGFILGVCFKAIIVSFIIVIYRKYAGGVHASTPNKCLIISVIVSVFPIFIVKKYVEFINLNMVLLIIFIIFIFSYYMVYKYAPVDSKQKRIKKESKKKRLKKGSLILLCIYFSIVIILILLYKFTLEKYYIIYSLSICIGVAWETFTLTKIAHIIFKK